MITLKNLIEQSMRDDDFDGEQPANEHTGTMGRSPTTWDTPKGFSPEGSPVRTNELAAQKKLTMEEKKNLLHMVSQFNEYRKVFKMADELKSVAENIRHIADMTEKYGLNETSEWFEGASLDRDMKELKRYAESLHKISNAFHPKIKEAESLYEEIGLKLERYFEL